MNKLKLLLTSSVGTLTLATGVYSVYLSDELVRLKSSFENGSTATARYFVNENQFFGLEGKINQGKHLLNDKDTFISREYDLSLIVGNYCSELQQRRLRLVAEQETLRIYPEVPAAIGRYRKLRKEISYLTISSFGLIFLSMLAFRESYKAWKEKESPTSRRCSEL